MGSGNIILLFSGYNDRAVVAFARTLQEVGVEFAIVARDHSDRILDSDYADKVVYIRNSNTLDRRLVSDVLDKVREVYGEVECLVAPSTEALNRFILRERSFLEEHGVAVPLVTEGLYSAISDKFSFAGMCRNSGIAVPGEYASLEATEYPFVAKPREFRSADGVVSTPFLIFDESQKAIFRKECDEGQFFFQEYIEGRSIYLLYYFGRNESVVKLSQENLVQQSGGKSIVAATTSHFHEGAESAKYEALFKSLGFRGLVMVEVRHAGSCVYMIEANPRFWGPSQLFMDAGLNLFEEFLYDYDVIEKRAGPAEIRPARYFWYGGFHAARLRSEPLVFHRGTEDEFLSELDDWVAIDVYRRKDTMKVFHREIE
jgi:predicted ATP-grasp superfamily ATP-dependent carboligase